MLSGLRQPVIAALHGYVFGSGIEIALFCDIRIASEDAVFGLPEVSLGMIPAAGGTQTLPRMIGRGKALQMLLTSDRIIASEALSIGLVNILTSRDELKPTAEGIARGIAVWDSVAVASAKQAIKQGLDLTLEEGLALERRLARVVKCAAS
jgi:enoyl-CoA hydratase/carnithine racemase